MAQGMGFANSCMRASKQHVEFKIPATPREHNPDLLNRRRMDRMRQELKSLRYQRKACLIALLLFSLPLTILGVFLAINFADTTMRGNYAAGIITVMMLLFGGISFKQNLQQCLRLSRRLQDNRAQLNRFQVGGTYK